MRAWIRLKLLYPVIKFPFTCCKILFIIWADTKVVLWELYPQGVIWTVFMCCVNKNICLPVKKVNSRGRPLPRYGFFSCAIFFVYFYFMSRSYSSTPSKEKSLLGWVQSWENDNFDFDWEHENFRLLILVYCVEGPLIEGLQQNIWLNLG